MLWKLIEGNSDHQVWMFEVNRGGLLRPWHAKNLVLEAKGRKGYSLMLNELDTRDSSHQQWHLDGQQLYNKSSALIERERGLINQCLDCWGGRVSEGTHITCWKFDQRKVHQRWEFVPLDTFEVTEMVPSGNGGWSIDLVSFYTAERLTGVPLLPQWPLTKEMRAAWKDGYDVRVFVYNNLKEKKRTIVAFENY